MSAEPLVPEAVLSEPADCPTCRAPTLAGERYCEACGARLTTAPEVTGAPTPAGAGTDRRVEIDLGGAAAVSDRGRRRPRNEDAMWMACDGDWSMAVVCDGVASTHDAHRASQAASESAGKVLEELVRTGRWPADPALLAAFRQAFGAAQASVCALTDVQGIDAELSPSTTLVAAVSTPGHLVVAGIGDSRAYWLAEAPDRSRLLTVDDSWAEEQISGGIDPQQAYADPEAHTITRWIGAGAGQVDVAITGLDVSEPGLLVLCTDGLWNYFEAPERLARQAFGAADQTPIGIARHLVRAALRAGGNDNVTVAVLPVGPPGAVSDRSPITEEEQR
jgi:serine/threonine protein phosphatase PrpC